MHLLLAWIKGAFRVQSFSSFGFKVSGLEFRASGLGSGFSGFGSRVSGFGFQISGVGCGFLVSSFELSVEGDLVRDCEDGDAVPRRARM